MQGRCRTLFGAAIGVCALVGCGEADSDGSGRTGRTGGSATSGAPDPFQNAAGSAGAGANTATMDFGNGSGNSSAPGASAMAPMVELMTDEGECGASSIEAEQVIVEETVMVEEEVKLPLDIYMIIDDSGSMVPWWPFTIDALNMFFNAPETAGIGVGMQFFGSSCDANTYANPRVAIAELPGNAGALMGAYPIIPLNDTATVPAMQGAIQHARAWSDSHPDTTVAVVLVTDGLPSDECGSTVQGVVDVVAEGYDGTPSIPTFVVGLGIALADLNQFAAAGGTGQATLVSPGAAGELLTALNTIRDTIVETRIEIVEKTVETPLECEWVIPQTPQGAGAFDREKVNVQLSSGGGASTPALGKVESPGECAAGGWHFDDNDAPERIVACPQTCTTIQSTTQAKVDILLGCKTIPLE